MKRMISSDPPAMHFQLLDSSYAQMNNHVKPFDFQNVFYDLPIEEAHLL